MYAGPGFTPVRMILKAYKRCFRALANETRLRILVALLTGRPKNVTQLSSELGLKQSTISHNLKRLLDCGFIGVRVRGHFHYYSANRQAIGPLFRLLEKHGTGGAQAQQPSPAEAAPGTAS